MNRGDKITWHSACNSMAMQTITVAGMKDLEKLSMQRKKIWNTILFSYIFIPNLYMFWALMCSSSGELIVSIWYLVYVTVCRWPSDMQVTYTEWHIPDVVLIQFSWWWAHECSKHVEIWNKHIRKKELCVKVVIYKNHTEMHGQQNHTEMHGQQNHTETHGQQNIKNIKFEGFKHWISVNIVFIKLN